ncbi:MAG TPA: hypothetical protein VGK93_04390 [Candidatus Eisenbacteria bacterium]|jgi:hypothetical protein
MRGTLLVLIAAGCAVGLSGCLTFREYDCELRLRPEAKAWEMTTTWYDLQSDEETAEKQRQDFEELIRVWKSDGYLLEGVHDGGYVKDRRLRIERGVLVGSETRLVDRNSRLESFELGPADTVRWKEPSLEVLSTNGTREIDGSGVTWGPGSGALRLRTRNRDFKPRSDFARMFKTRPRNS